MVKVILVNCKNIFCEIKHVLGNVYVWMSDCKYVHRSVLDKNL